MAVLLDALRSVDFLAPGPDERVVRFMVLGRATYRAKGELVWRAGSAADRFVVPVTGTLKRVTRSDEGREFITAFVDPGEAAGLSEVIEEQKFMDDAVVSRKGEFFTMTKQGLSQFLSEWPDAKGSARASVTAYHRRVRCELSDVVLRPLLQRFAGFLLDNSCVLRDDGARVLLDVSQADMAARLGTVREVVTRMIARLMHRELIQRSPFGLVVLDWERLQNFAGDRSSCSGPLAHPGDADVVEDHTRHYFLPMRERDHGRAQAAECADRMGDLTRCAEAGCPAAIAHVQSPSSATRPPRPKTA